MPTVRVLIGFILSIQCFSRTCNGQIKPDSAANLKNIGNEILAGTKISGIEEKYLYKLIDSIVVKDSTERRFYFSVFKQIRKEAEGYLAEEINFHSKEYCYAFPDEFFAMSSAELKSYAHDIGELFRTEEEFPEQAAKDYISEIKKRCNSNFRKKVDRFSHEIFEDMK